MNRSAQLVATGGIVVFVMGLLLGTDLAQAPWMAVTAVGVAVLTAGLATAGAPYVPAAVAFGVFTLAHVACAFGASPDAVLSPAGAVVLIGLAVSGVLVLRSHRAIGVPRILPLLASAWCVLVPIGAIFGGDLGHEAAIATIGPVWASLSLTIISESYGSRPVVAGRR